MNHLNSNFEFWFLELREAFEAEAQEVKKPRLLLTAAVPVGPDNIKGGYDVPAVSSWVLFFFYEIMISNFNLFSKIIIIFNTF